MKTNHNNYIKLAFDLAKYNLGKTSLNPSVGCVVVKDHSVLSSGFTSKNGRPHAEFNALNNKKNLENCDLYVTMEPCTHYGLTPPCTNLIIKKKIKRVFFTFDDKDKRTAKKLKSKLSKNKILVSKKFESIYKDFYQSYFLIKEKKIPMIDAKIAVSRDFYTINKKSKWITNSLSRKRSHLLRSEYDAVLSTSKSINKDNSLLNCRIEGLDNNKPDLIIIDLKLRIKKNIKLFKKKTNRKMILVTSVNNKEKVRFLRMKGCKIIFVKSLISKTDFVKLFKIMEKFKFGRILVETGLVFLNNLLKEKLISNLYVFQSHVKLGKNGKNNASNCLIKKFNLTKQLKVNLNNDKIYKVKF